MAEESESTTMAVSGESLLDSEKHHGHDSSFDSAKPVISSLKDKVFHRGKRMNLSVCTHYTHKHSLTHRHYLLVILDLLQVYFECYILLNFIFLIYYYM